LELHAWYQQLHTLHGLHTRRGDLLFIFFKCSILDRNDKVRVVSTPKHADFKKPSIKTGPVGEGTGPSFNLTETDKVGALRADGSIKLRMVVHLNLP